MPEAVMLLFFNQLESLRLVDAARRVEDVVGPEHDLAVAGAPCEVDAFVDQTIAEAESPRRRLDVEETQLRDGP